MDELACGPSQVLAGLRPCPWWTGYCRSEVAALRVPYLTEACIFTIVHLIVITSDFAQWQLWRLRKIWLGCLLGPHCPGQAPASPGALPTSSRLSCCFTGHHRWSWSGLRCLRSPLSFLSLESLPLKFREQLHQEAPFLQGCNQGIPEPAALGLSHNRTTAQTNHPRAQAVE